MTIRINLDYFTKLALTHNYCQMTELCITYQSMNCKLSEFLLQNYVWCGGESYVDIGFGSYRVKCRVHRKFR